MNVLLACYRSHTLREAIERNGHEVTTCDLSPLASPGRSSRGRHIQGDVLRLVPGSWDFIFAFPPCTYLSRAQAWRCNRDNERAAKRMEAVNFVRRLMDCGCDHIAIENPVGFLSQAYRPPDQIVRPWWFGDPYRKEICLWMKNVPPLIATCYNPVRKSIQNHVNGRMSQAQKSEIKSSWNWFPGMCQAIADQWFPPLLCS